MHSPRMCARPTTILTPAPCPGILHQTAFGTIMTGRATPPFVACSVAINSRIMRRHLKSSLIILSVATIAGLVIHTFNHSSVAHASLEAGTPVSPLVQLTDSLRRLSRSLDARIREIHTLDSTLAAHLELPAMSTELRGLRKSLAISDAPYFGIILPDAFYLMSRIDLQRRYIDSITVRIETLGNTIAHLPTFVPVDGTPSSNFGRRLHPIDGVWKNHTGLDFAAPRGTEIHAAGNGVVITAGTQKGYGNIVEIDHGFGYRTRYAHCSSTIAKAGDTVRRGDLIATVGTTGRATGPHLHFEMVVDDATIDPLEVLRAPLSLEQSGVVYETRRSSPVM